MLSKIVKRASKGLFKNAGIRKVVRVESEACGVGLLLLTPKILHPVVWRLNFYTCFELELKLLKQCLSLS